MKSPYLVALICSLLATVQQAYADIAPGPPPPPDQSLPIVLAGVCLSLATVFFGLWFVNQRKAERAKVASAGGAASSRSDLNQFSGRH